MKTQQLTEISAEEFDAFAQKHPLKTLFQDSRWAKLKAPQWQARFLALKSDQQIAIASLILVRKLPLGFRLWYLPRGPLYTTQQGEELAVFSQKLRRLGRRQRALMIKADPNLILSRQDFSQARNQVGRPRPSKALEQIKAAKWHHFGFNQAMADTIQPRYNAVVELKVNWEEALGNTIKQSVRKAQQAKISLELLDDNQVQRFADLITLTAKHQGISLRDLSYFKKIKQLFQDHCLILVATLRPNLWLEDNQNKLQQAQAKLAKLDPNKKVKQHQDMEKQCAAFVQKIKEINELTANQERIDLAASLAILDQERLEILYSGMDRRFNKLRATSVVDYEMLKLAENRGCQIASFGGIEGKLDDALSEFKQSFGSQVEEYLGEFTLYTYPIISWLFAKILPKIKKIISRVRAKRTKFK